MHQITVNGTTARLLAAAGIIAAIPAAELPAGHGLLHSTAPVALTSVDISGAEAFLYNPDSTQPINLLGNGDVGPSAFGSLTSVYGDAQVAFHDSPSATSALALGEMLGLLNTGQLLPGAAGSSTDILSATGLYVPAPNLPAAGADVDVAHDTTATQLFTGAVDEANIETVSLQHLQALAAADAPGLGTEHGVASDLALLQEDINGSLNALNNALDPTSLDAYESNGFLDAMLHGLLVSELNLNSESGGVAAQLLADTSSSFALPMDSDPVLAGDDANMITNELGEYGYMQGIVGFFAMENAIGDVEGWFHSL